MVDNSDLGVHTLGGAPSSGGPEDDEDWTGRRLDDRFVVRALIGAGAHGAVYDAWDERHESPVALKTLLRLSPEALVRFKAEFRVLSDISHPNLVNLHELFVGEGGAYFTMELVEGMDWLSWVRGPDLDRCDMPRLRDGMRQLSRGLAALHGFGLVHRDLKPSNVLVREDGQVLVADFGLARHLSAGQPGDGAFGTPAYMSPEQAADLEVGTASDWYSLGVMLYESLTGEYPFQGMSGLGLMMTKQLDGPGGPSKLMPDVPADLDALCEQLLHRDVAARPSGADVMRRLGAAVDSLGRGSESSDEDAVFVGRQAELAELGEVWAALCDDAPGRTQAAVAVLAGPSGVGKSALAEHFLGHQVTASALVLRGRCYERESVPFKGLDALVDSLREHLLITEGEAIADLPGVGALARLFAVLNDVPGVRDSLWLPIEDPFEQRRQAVDALRELLRRLAAAQPLILVIDDLQWCDEDTAAVLLELLRPQHRPSLLLLATCRNDDVTGPLVGRLLAGLAKLEAVTVASLAVGPLKIASAEALARRLLPAEADPELARSIAREAEGNPLFVAELVRHPGARETGQTTRSLSAVVCERVAELSTLSRRILQVVAAADRPTPQHVVLEAASVDQGGTKAVALLRSRAFVRTHGPNPSDAIEPFHARIAAAVISDMTADALREHHGSLAAALERASADPEVIADHLVRAGEPAGALGYLEVASVQAMGALAFGRAARLCSSALEHVPAGDARCGPLRRRLADALAHDGRGVPAAAAYLKAAEVAIADDVVELRRAAAEQLLRCGRHEQGEAELRAVLSDVGLYAPSGPRAALMALVALRAKIWRRGTEFVEVAEAQVDPAALLAIDTTWTAATGLLQSNVLLGQYFQARHLLLALEAGEPHRLARALVTEGLYTATGGTRATVGTDRLNEQLVGLSRRLGDARSEGGALLAAAVADLYRGRFAEAVPRLEAAEQIYRRRCTNVHWEISMVRLFWVLSLYYLGDLPAMREVIAVGLQDAVRRDDLYTQLMLRASFEPIIFLFDDDLDGARRVFSDLREHNAEPLQTATHRYTLMLTLSRIERYEGYGPTAWAPFGQHWAAVRRSLMLTKQPFKIFSLHDRAVGALAAARASDGVERRRLLARARRDGQSLWDEGTRWSRAMALPITASVAAADGDMSGALRDAVAAERAFAELSLSLYRWSMRWRRGECLGGDEGDAAIADAERQLRALGVAQPVALVRMLVPAVLW